MDLFIACYVFFLSFLFLNFTPKSHATLSIFSVILASNGGLFGLVYHIMASASYEEEVVATQIFLFTPK